MGDRCSNLLDIKRQHAQAYADNRERTEREGIGTQRSSLFPRVSGGGGGVIRALDVVNDGCTIPWNMEYSHLIVHDENVKSGIMRTFGFVPDQAEQLCVLFSAWRETMTHWGKPPHVEFNTPSAYLRRKNN